MDPETEIEVNFVGRDRDLEKLQSSWRQYRFLGVYGMRAVGKSRLVREFIHRQRNILPSHTECEQSQEKSVLLSDRDIFPCSLPTGVMEDKTLTVDMKVSCGNNCKECIYNRICKCFGIQPCSGKMKESDLTDLIVQTLTEIEDKRSIIICFDNAEDIIEGPQSGDFLTLCVDMATFLQNIHIIIISTTQPQFDNTQGLYTFHRVDPLTKEDSKLLFHAVAPDVKLCQYEGAMLEMTEGLPLLILMVASELTADGGLFNVEEMVQLLTEFRLRTLSREYYPSEDRVADVYKKFIQRLPSNLIESLAALDFIPGPFDMNEAHEILALPSPAIAEHTAVLPAVRRHMITKHPNTYRFNIQGVLREVLRIYFAVRNLPEIRLRYCKVFTSVITELARQSTSAAFKEAAETFTHEELNLQKLLQQVNNADHEQVTYHFFLEIATECTLMLERFFTGMSDGFYRGCERLAKRYGSDVDRARIRIAVGSYHTNVKDDYLKGMVEYRKAHEVLKGGKSSNKSNLKASVLVLQRLGWNIHMRGRDREAVGYFESVLRESSKLEPQDVNPVRIQALNSLGFVNTNLGNYNTARGLLNLSLKFSKARFGENHPSVGVTLLNTGYLYENQSDNKSAAKYYKLGYEVISKYAEQTGKPLTILADALIDRAKAHCAHHDFINAHRCLHESSCLLKKQEEPSLNIASRLYFAWGNVMREEGNLDGAVDMLQKTLEKLEVIDKNGMRYMQCLVNIAKVKTLQKHYASAMLFAKKALLLKNSVSEYAPFSRLSLETLYCIAEIHLKTNENVNYNLTLDDIKVELLKRRDLFEGEEDEEETRKIDDELVKLGEKRKAD